MPAFPMPNRSSPRRHPQPSGIGADMRTQPLVRHRAWLCSRCGAREVTCEPAPKPQRCLSCFALEGRDSEFTPLDDMA